jgi:flavin reductase (DIM6/NTAB) family NADH-FMN oxidoreductase RutF
VNHALPPRESELPLEVGIADWAPDDLYFLHTSLIVPRPIAWVSSVSADGRPNLAPFSYFNAVSDDPPMVMFVCDGQKNTLRNVRASHEFVINLASVDLAEKLDATAIEFPDDENEFEWAGVEAEPSRTVRPPRVADAKAAMECALDRVVDIGVDSHVVFGFVKHYRVAASIWANGRVDPQLYRPLCRLAGRYAELRPEFKIERPSLEQALATGKPGLVGLMRRVERGAGS